MKPRYSIGENEMAYAFGLSAAKLAAKTLWEEGATGLNRIPLWVYDAKGRPVGCYAGGSWSRYPAPVDVPRDFREGFTVVTGLLRIEAAREIVARRRARKR